jgi:hypothetical protein
MPRQDDLEKLIIEHTRRLQKLKEQQAKYGITTEPHILIEIEDIEAKINELQTELAELKRRYDESSLGSPPDTPPIEPNPKLASFRSQPRIFLCHASEDKPRVKELYHQLKDAGYRPWLDKFDLLPGQDWEFEIWRVIRESDFFLACLSHNSTDKRGYVQKEIRIGLDVLDQIPEGKIYLIPTRLELCEVPERLKSRHWVDLFEPDGFEYLTKALDSGISKRKAEITQLQTLAAEVKTPLEESDTTKLVEGLGGFMVTQETTSESQSPKPEMTEPTSWADIESGAHRNSQKTKVVLDVKEILKKADLQSAVNALVNSDSVEDIELELDDKIVNQIRELYITSNILLVGNAGKIKVISQDSFSVQHNLLEKCEIIYDEKSKYPQLNLTRPSRANNSTWQISRLNWVQQALSDYDVEIFSARTGNLIGKIFTRKVTLSYEQPYGEMGEKFLIVIPDNINLLVTKIIEVVEPKNKVDNGGKENIIVTLIKINRPV